MRGKSFSEEQIIKALKSHEAGTKVADICRELGIVEQTFYGWQEKYGDIESAGMKRLRAAEAENRKLKQQLADLEMDRMALKEALSRKW